jgi:hypothetical protein
MKGKMKEKHYSIEERVNTVLSRVFLAIHNPPSSLSTNIATKNGGKRKKYCCLCLHVWCCHRPKPKIKRAVAPPYYVFLSPTCQKTAISGK